MPGFRLSGLLAGADREFLLFFSISQGFRRFRELALLYLAIVDQSTPFPTTLEELRGFYDKVMDGELDAETAPDGALFRSGPVTIHSPSQREIHRGVTPEEAIHRALREFLRIHGGTSAPRLVSVMIGHFMFEYVHPFYDGNGRTGRYLLGLALSRILSPATALTLSRELAERKNRYYKGFSVVEHPLNRADATPFVEIMLDILCAAQRSLLEELGDKIEQLAELGQRITALETTQESNLDRKTVRTLYLLGQAHLFGSALGVELREVAGFNDKTPQTARAYLEHLESLGFTTVTSRKPLRFILTAEGQELLFDRSTGEPA